MESTIEQPIRFFENFILNEIKIFINNEFTNFIQNSDIQNPTINHQRLEISYLEFNDNNEIVERCYSIYNKLERKLKFEFNNSKDLLNQASSEKDIEQFNRLVLNVHKTLQYIIRKGEENIINYPVLLKPITGITAYINEKFLYNSKSQIKLELLNIESGFENLNQETDNYKKIVYSVIGYMNGENDRREKIMTNEDFQLMMSYLMEYFQEGSSLINQKIKHVKISKSLLRYSFWVLHKKLYTTDVIQDNFVHLIWSMFIDFESWEYRTLKIKFGSRDKVRFRKVNFLPEVIKAELRENNQ